MDGSPSPSPYELDPELEAEIARELAALDADDGASTLPPDAADAADALALSEEESSGSDGGYGDALPPSLAGRAVWRGGREPPPSSLGRPDASSGAEFSGRADSGGEEEDEEFKELVAVWERREARLARFESSLQPRARREPRGAAPSADSPSPSEAPPESTAGPSAAAPRREAGDATAPSSGPSAASTSAATGRSFENGGGYGDEEDEYGDSGGTYGAAPRPHPASPPPHAVAAGAGSAPAGPSGRGAPPNNTSALSAGGSSPRPGGEGTSPSEGGDAAPGRGDVSGSPGGSSSSPSPSAASAAPGRGDADGGAAALHPTANALADILASMAQRLGVSRPGTPEGGGEGGGTPPATATMPSR